MEEQYFYVTDGQRKGPVSFAALRELATRAELKRTAKVWCRGMKDWQAADSVTSLFEDLPPDLQAEPCDLPPSLSSRGDGPNFETPPPLPLAAGPARKQRSPGLMALASFILPGLGQLISGQDGKGLLLIIVSIAASVPTYGLSNLALCPLMSIDAYGIAKKANTEGIRKWKFFPGAPSINGLAPHVVPAAIITGVLLLAVIVRLEQKNEIAARNEQKFEDLIQQGRELRGY